MHDSLFQLVFAWPLARGYLPRISKLTVCMFLIFYTMALQTGLVS